MKGDLYRVALLFSALLCVGQATNKRQARGSSKKQNQRSRRKLQPPKQPCGGKGDTCAPSPPPKPCGGKGDTCPPTLVPAPIQTPIPTVPPPTFPPPTATPTTAPPTPWPTTAPPTPWPTVDPTPLPTLEPTPVPTPDPTASPAPSESPSTSFPSESPTSFPTVTPMPSVKRFETLSVTNEDGDTGKETTCFEEPPVTQVVVEEVLFGYTLNLAQGTDPNPVVAGIQDGLHIELAGELLTCDFGGERMRLLQDLTQPPIVVEAYEMSTFPLDQTSQTPCSQEEAESGFDCYKVDAGLTATFTAPVSNVELVNMFGPPTSNYLQREAARNPNIGSVSGFGFSNTPPGGAETPGSDTNGGSGSGGASGIQGGSDGSSDDGADVGIILASVGVAVAAVTLLVVGTLIYRRRQEPKEKKVYIKEVSGEAPDVTILHEDTDEDGDRGFLEVLGDGAEVVLGPVVDGLNYFYGEKEEDKKQDPTFLSKDQIADLAPDRGVHSPNVSREYVSPDTVML